MRDGAIHRVDRVVEQLAVVGDEPRRRVEPLVPREHVRIHVADNRELGPGPEGVEVHHRAAALANSRPMRPPPTSPKRTTRSNTGGEARERLLGGRALVHDRHEGARHPGRIRVLDDVAPVDDSGRALLEDGLGAAQDLLVGSAPPAPHEHRHAACRFHDPTVFAELVCGVGLDDVGAQLDRLADEVTTVSASPFTP